MAFAIQRPGTAGKVIDASADETGAVVIPDADLWLRHRFYVAIATAATVKFEASPDGATWFTVASSLTATGLQSINGPWANLRLSWTGNNATVSAWCEQLYGNTNEVL